MHLNSRVYWIRIASRIKTLIAVDRREPRPKEAARITVTRELLEHKFASWVSSAGAGDPPGKCGVIGVWSDHNTQLADRRRIWQAVIPYQTVTLNLSTQMRARSLDDVIQTVSTRNRRQKIYHHGR